MNFNPKEQTQKCINWIQTWFEKQSGNANGAIIGISGGKDSTVVAALLCKAIGNQRVLGVLMPNGIQNDISDSHQICKILNIRNITVNIETAFNGIINAIEMDLSKQSKINIPPRLRMTILYTLGQELNYRVAGTGNLSERYIGYTTKWGDSACDFNPIGNFTTDEVIKIGAELGLPKDLIEKVPADGLSGKSDEENIGFSYKILNKYIREGVCEDAEIKGKIEKLHQISRHKQEPIPMYRYFFHEFDNE